MAPTSVKAKGSPRGIWVTTKDVLMGITVCKEFGDLDEANAYAVEKAEDGYLVKIEVDGVEVARWNAELAEAH